MFDHAEEYVRFRNAPCLPGVELYAARLVGHAFSAHVHEAFSLGVIEAGAQRFRYRGTNHVADAGTLVLLNPDEPHTGEAAVAAGWRYRNVYVSPELFAQLAGGAAWFATPTAREPVLAGRLAGALDLLWDAPEPLAGQVALLGVVGDIAARLGREAAKVRVADGRGRFAVVLDYIEAHLDQPLDLAVLAGLAGLSMHHFARSFAAAFHVSPHRYVQARRLLRAKRLLAGRHHVAAVAAEVGLTDQSHLTRWFRQTYGVTPGQYQAQIGTRPA